MLFLSKKSVGIDIADRSVEVVELEKTGNKVKLISLGRAELSPGIVVRGRIKDKDKLKLAVLEAMSEARPKPIKAKKIVFGLSENRLYSHVFELPVNRKKSVSALVEEEAKNGLPIKWSDLAYSYNIIEGKGDNSDPHGERILLIGASKKIITAWQEFFKTLDMEVEIFDAESLAIFRGLGRKKTGKPVFILDIGSVATNIYIFNGKGLYYCHTFNCGGDDFTRQIAEYWKTADGKKIEFDEAEKIKKEFGISGSDEEHEDITQILKNASASIVEETKIALAYFKERTGQDIGEMILVGGSANLKGILNCFSTCLIDANKKIANPAGNSEAEEETDKLRLENASVSIGKSFLNPGGETLYYIEAVGLAMRNFSGQWEKNDPFLSPIEVSRKKTPAGGEKKEDSSDTEGAFDPDAGEKRNWLKDHPKEIQLAVVLLIGALLIGGAFWYRQSSSQERLKNITAENANPFVYPAALPFQMTVNTAKGILATGEIRGRIIKTSVGKAAAYEDGAKTAKTSADKELKKGEGLWKEPVNKIKDNEKILFPLEFSWLAFSETDSASAYLSEAKKEINGRAGFIFKSAEMEKISHDNPTSTVFILSGMVEILMDKKVPGLSASVDGNASSSLLTEDKGRDELAGKALTTPQEMTATASPISIQSVEDVLSALNAAKKNTFQDAIIINNPDQGFANVRTGPGTSFSLIKKANNGEEFQFLEEKDGWFQIKLGDNEEGWIINSFGYRKKP